MLTKGQYDKLNMFNISLGKFLNNSKTLWDDDVVKLSLQENIRVRNEINKYPDNKGLQKQRTSRL